MLSLSKHEEPADLPSPKRSSGFAQAGALDGKRGSPQAATMNDRANDYMQKALDLARAAGAAGEVPVGAVLVEASTGAVLAAERNRTEELDDPTAHAEMLAIREASKKRGQSRPDANRLEGCDLYVTLEPCPMCAAAISFARIRRLVFGAYDPKGGGVEHGARVFDQPTCHHAPEVIGGVQETQAGEILKVFFRERR
jgi:tRNA(Arg) A34 adenosine deaminase TadA